MPNNIPYPGQVDPSEVDDGQSLESEGLSAAESEGQDSAALDEGEASGAIIAE